MLNILIIILEVLFIIYDLNKQPYNAEYLLNS